jgi:hypothetical protein
MRLDAPADIVKLLLGANADRNQGVNGMRPIDLARRENKPDVVALLLTEGQPSWGSGQPRPKQPGTTSKSLVRSQRAHRGDEQDLDHNLDELPADPLQKKVVQHRERLLKLKDGSP